MTVGLVVSIVAVVFVAWFIMMYNGLVKLRNNRERIREYRRAAQAAL